MSAIIQNLLDALSVGGIYALIALGMGLIFGIMGLINFAQGNFIMIGAYAIFLMSGRPVFIVVATTLVVVILLALSTDRFVFRPIRGAEGNQEFFLHLLPGDAAPAAAAERILGGMVDGE